MNDLDMMAQLDLHLPTIQGVHVYVHCQFTTSRWGVTCFYQQLRLCFCGTKPQHSGNHWCGQLCDDVIMRTPMSPVHHHENSKNHGKTQDSCSRGLKTPLTKIPLL